MSDVKSEPDPESGTTEINGFKVSNIARATYNTSTRRWVDADDVDVLRANDDDEPVDAAIAAVPPPSAPLTSSTEPEPEARKPSQEQAAIIEQYTQHGIQCSTIDAEALALSALDPDEDPSHNPITQDPYDALLDKIENVLSEADHLIETITYETQKKEGGGGLDVFDNFLPILRARLSNLAMARSLAEGAKENRRLSLRLRDLQFGDEEDSESDPESED